MIQIDQSTDPTKVTVAGEAHSLQTAVDMVKVSLPPTSAGAWPVASPWQGRAALGRLLSEGRFPGCEGTPAERS